MEKFREKVTDYLIEQEQGKADHREGLRAYADEKLRQAEALGLESEIDLLNFTICCKRHDEGFLPYLKGMEPASPDDDQAIQERSAFLAWIAAEKEIPAVLLREK